MFRSPLFTNPLPLAGPRFLLVPYLGHWLFPSVHFIVLIQLPRPPNTEVSKCWASAHLVPKMTTFRPRIHRGNVVCCTCAEFMTLSIEMQHETE